MRILIEAGNAIRDFYFDDTSQFKVDQPMRGWITVTSEGHRDVWLQSHYIIGMFPSTVKEAS